MSNRLEMDAKIYLAIQDGLKLEREKWEKTAARARELGDEALSEKALKYIQTSIDALNWLHKNY